MLRSTVGSAIAHQNRRNCCRVTCMPEAIYWPPLACSMPPTRDCGRSNYLTMTQALRDHPLYRLVHQRLSHCSHSSQCPAGTMDSTCSDAAMHRHTGNGNDARTATSSTCLRHCTRTGKLHNRQQIPPIAPGRSATSRAPEFVRQRRYGPSAHRRHLAPLAGRGHGRGAMRLWHEREPALARRPSP